MLALLFPGQGSQTDGDRAEVERLAPDLLQLVLAEMGEDPFLRVGESTRYAQPAIFVTSLARLRGAAPLSGRASVMAGHSLGEITALTAAGALTAEDALRLVVERGRLMAAAQAGGMIVVKASIDDAARVAEAQGLAVANDNAPGQVVLSGTADRLDQAVAAARDLGLRATRLGVSGAFHSPLMQPARAAFAAVLDDTDFRKPAMPVYCCATAAPFTDPRRQLAEALTAPVRWREVVHAMHRRGVRTFAEVGPGRVLDGLVRRTLPEATRTPLQVEEPARA
ncbi:MAG: acyltransferase domain-containing protein [Solirubrobacteraceae bacterium]|nr:acyltransferase domain-containing protein [Solirubrobacteraceae bacterium]